MTYVLKCDPRAYWRMKEIIQICELEGYDGAVVAVKAITGENMAGCHVSVDVCLPTDPIFPSGYGHIVFNPT